MNRSDSKVLNCSDNRVVNHLDNSVLNHSDQKGESFRQWSFDECRK